MTSSGSASGEPGLADARVTEHAILGGLGHRIRGHTPEHGQPV